MTTTAVPPLERNQQAAAGGDPKVQLATLKAHLTFQHQDLYQRVRLDWCTEITKDQSRAHITRELHRKINSKEPQRPQAGKLDTEEGQLALHTNARLIRAGKLHGGNGFHLLGWNLRFRMYRTARAHAGTEESFWQAVSEEGNAPKLRPKEEEFPEYIQRQHAMHRRARELAIAQGARPKDHPDAYIVQMDHCPECEVTYLSSEVEEMPGYQCTGCRRHYFLGQTPEETAVIPGDPPTVITPETPPLRRRRKTT